MVDSRAVLRSVFRRQALEQAALRYLEIARPLLTSVLYSAQQPAAIREMRSLGPRTTWVVVVAAVARYRGVPALCSIYHLKKKPKKYTQGRIPIRWAPKVTGICVTS